MLFPISDDDRHLDGPAWVTIGLIVLNVVVFVLFQGLGANEAFTRGRGDSRRCGRNRHA